MNWSEGTSSSNDPRARARDDNPAAEFDRATLRSIVAHVLAVGRPLFEDQLVDRLARAHGMRRSDGQIRQSVLSTSPPEAVCLEEANRRKVVWARRPGTVPYRPDPTGARGHGDVPTHELASIAVPLIRLRMGEEDILRRIAETLDIGRLREGTRARMMAAVAIARSAAS